jgi:hypothetical protein
MLAYKMKPELLLMRCGPETEVEENENICFHHEQLFVSKYHLLHKTCCNPFKSNKKTVKRGLRQIYVGTLELFNECVNTDSIYLNQVRKNAQHVEVRIWIKLK